MIKLGNSWLFVQDKITRPVEVALFRNAIILAQLLLLYLLGVLVSCDGEHWEDGGYSVCACFVECNGNVPESGVCGESEAGGIPGKNLSENGEENFSI